VPRIGVVAHSGKSFGGGLGELRDVLAQEGIADPLWYEVRKSRKAPRSAREALAQGAETIFVWGGDGTVQRCIDAVAGTGAAIAILPAGTANLLANNLQVPADLAEAVRTGLKGDRRWFDTGSVNGEHFAVMAGAGFDARMIEEAGRGMKGRFGRAAYLYAGAKNLSARRVRAIIDVDGRRFFKGRISCVLVGNVDKVLGELRSSAGRSPMTGYSNSALSQPRIRLSGRGRWGGSCRAGPENRRSLRSPGVSGSGSGSAGLSPMSLTAARAAQSRNCGSRSIPARSRSAVEPTRVSAR
jgi:diacylglycerol kinase (ATP)